MTSLPRSLTAALDTALDKTVLPGYSSIGVAIRRRWWPDDPAAGALEGKHVVVTGASGGLGLAAAQGIARYGATVHLVGRSGDRLAEAAAVIGSRLPQARLVEDVCDVSDIVAARAYGVRLREELGSVHAVVHDAGVMPVDRTESAQSHELTLATHVLGPIAMTEALRPALAASGDGRVVIVSSGGMYSAPLDHAVADDIEFTQGYEGIRAYARTKRIQVTMTELLAQRYASDRIVVHSMHPGWAATPGITESMPRFARFIRPVLRTADQGADTIVWLTASDEPLQANGLFWCDRKPRPTYYLPWQHDDAAARRTVWAYLCRAADL